MDQQRGKVVRITTGHEENFEANVPANYTYYIPMVTSVYIFKLCPGNAWFNCNIYQNKPTANFLLMVKS
jgi:hypothetical protein